LNTFEFSVPAYLIKSGNKTEPYKVGGIISTEERDTDGEIMKSIDWSYFTSGFGKIKYEHKDIPEPDCFIGFPTKLGKSGKTWKFEGELVAFDPDLPDEKLTRQQQLAKSTVSFLQHIGEFNQRHPSTLQKAGWSIEGEYLSKSKDGLVAARVVNVVFTTKPRNRGTLAELVKSLEVGYGMNPGEQTGFGATRKESIDHNIKLNGVTKMETKNDIYKKCLAKGMTPEQAKKEADDFETKQKGEMNESFETAAKSLGAAKLSLQKSLDTAKSISEIDFEIDVKAQEKSLQKSIATMNKGGEDADITEYLEKSSELSLGALKALDAINQKVDLLAKSIVLLAEGQLNQVSGDEHLVKSLDLVNNQVEDQRMGLITLVSKLRKSSGGNLLTDNINWVENNKNVGTGAELNKAQKVKVLEKLVAEKSVDEIVLVDFSAGGTQATLPESVEQLVKSKAVDMFK